MKPVTVILSKYLGRSYAEIGQVLKKVFTHASYVKQEQLRIDDCSRYVFLGMFAFRGLVAKHIENFKPGTGQQLQHTLGNMFSNKRLNALYDTWNLQKYIRVGSDFSVKDHRHIFVYALFGYLYKHVEEEMLLNFINNHFIDFSDLNQHNSIKHDQRAQLEFLFLQVYHAKPRFEIKRIGEFYRVSILLKDATVLSEQTSKSLHFAKKNAITKALKSIAIDHENKIQHYAEFLSILQLKEEKIQSDKKKQIFEKHQLVMQKQSLRKQARYQSKLDRKEEKRLQEERRRRAKAERKKKLDDLARIKAEQANRTISVAKRRFLEDKAN